MEHPLVGGESSSCILRCNMNPIMAQVRKGSVAKCMAPRQKTAWTSHRRSFRGLVDCHFYRNAPWVAGARREHRTPLFARVHVRASPGAASSPGAGMHLQSSGPKVRLASGGARPLHASPSHVHPSTHVGFHLGAVRGACRRRKDRTRPRAGGHRRRIWRGLEKRLAEHRLARKSSSLGWLFGSPRARDRGRSRASTSSVTSAAARPC